MAETFQINIRDAERNLAVLGRQAPFVFMLTLNALARDGKLATEKELNRVFDRPVPFTLKGVGVLNASKDFPVAQIFLKDRQAEYLDLQIRGGIRRGGPGKPFFIPETIPVNVHGNIRRGAIKRERSKPRAFVASKSDPATKHFKPGIYIRRNRKRKGNIAILRVSFAEQGRYKKRYDFVKPILRAVRRNTGNRIIESVKKAFATARIK